MNVLQRSRRLACVAGGAVLALVLAGMSGMAGVAAAAVPAPAQARVTGMIFQSHVVASWGVNSYGQLGDGTTTSRSRYGDVNALGNDVVRAAAGYFHSLAVRSDGTVWTWGDNQYGQLGDGTRTNRGSPVRVMGLTGVTQVAAGYGHSLALRSDGTVWAWGSNTVGQLGSGVISDYQLTPVQVTGLTGVTKISAGAIFSLALCSDGTVWAWGANQAGQLGNGTTANSSVPVKVAGLSQVTGISAGEDASVATRTNGISAVTSVWTWGGNNTGQLGDGTQTGHTTPERVTGLPAYIAGVGAGGAFAMVLGTDGSVWGWGEDLNGQLGNAPASLPVTRPVNTIGAGSGITQISAGLGHVLALKSDGTVLAWGASTDGQLGNGTTAIVVGPVQVTGLTSATQVSAGRAFSLAIHTVPWLTGQSS